MLYFVLPTRTKFWINICIYIYIYVILRYYKNHKCVSNRQVPLARDISPLAMNLARYWFSKGTPNHLHWPTGGHVYLQRSVQRSKNTTSTNCKIYQKYHCITKLYHIDKHWSHSSQLCLGPKFALEVCWLNCMLRIIQAWFTTFSTFLSAWVRLSGTAWNDCIAHDGWGCLKNLKKNYKE